MVHFMTCSAGVASKLDCLCVEVTVTFNEFCKTTESGIFSCCITNALYQRIVFCCCRLTRSVTNPAFFTENQSKFNSVQISEGLTRSIANESLAKMMAIEKCDRTIVNPVHGSEPKYKALVGACMQVGHAACLF